MVADTGARVAWANVSGSYAGRIAAAPGKLVPVPDGISSEIAAAALLQGMTAHYLASDSYPIEAGDWVLVHAAAGGVGLLLTQIAKLRGGRVIGTTSTEEKAVLARESGADEVIGYEGFAQHVREITGGEGVAAVYDGVGRMTFLEGLTALRPTGTDDHLRRRERPAGPARHGRPRPCRLALRAATDVADVHADAGAPAGAGPATLRADRRAAGFRSGSARAIRWTRHGRRTKRCNRGTTTGKLILTP